MSINLTQELNVFTDWLNEEKGQIFTKLNSQLISWDDGSNECTIMVINNCMVTNEPAFQYCEEFIEYQPQRKPGRQEDIEDYLSGHDELNSIIQSSIQDYLNDKQYDVPGNPVFIHSITVTMEVPTIESPTDS